jgi:hypothetical protein
MAACPSPPISKVSATTIGGVLAITFSGKTTLDPAAGAPAMPRVLSGGRADADGKTLRFTLSQPVKLHVSQIGSRAVVDIADTNFAGVMPDLVTAAQAGGQADRCRLPARDQAAHRQL